MESEVVVFIVSVIGCTEVIFFVKYQYYYIFGS